MIRGDAAPHPRLVGDIGGTHLRFARVGAPGGEVGDPRTYRWSEVQGLEDAIRRYLEQCGEPSPAAAALAIAGPVSGDSVHLTNRSGSFSIEALRRRFDLERLVVLNDFAALALAIPLLAENDSRAIGGGAALPDGTVAVLGAGTGLGVSALVTTPAGRIPVASEGGHATLCGSDATEDRLLSILRREFGHVSFERVLSGAGIGNLYRAQCALAGTPAEPHDAAEIVDRACRDLDPSCVAALDHFFAFLGTFAGNLALTLEARGGVYLGGGILPRLVERIGASRFRERFEGKGRMRSHLEAIPTRLITNPARAALRGANGALDRPTASP